MNNKIYSRIVLCGLLSSSLMMFGMEEQDQLVLSQHSSPVTSPQLSPQHSSPTKSKHRHQITERHEKRRSTSLPTDVTLLMLKNPLSVSQDVVNKLEEIQDTINEKNNVIPTPEIETNIPTEQEVITLVVKDTIRKTKNKREAIGAQISLTEQELSSISEESLAQFIIDINEAGSTEEEIAVQTNNDTNHIDTTTGKEAVIENNTQNSTQQTLKTSDSDKSEEDFSDKKFEEFLGDFIEPEKAKTIIKIAQKATTDTPLENLIQNIEQAIDSEKVIDKSTSQKTLINSTTSKQTSIDATNNKTPEPSRYGTYTIAIGTTIFFISLIILLKKYNRLPDNITQLLNKIMSRNAVI